MTPKLLASDLGFPEGPVIMPDGNLVFCDGNIGQLLRYDGSVGTFAHTGGSPWGAVLGSDGAVYVTQGGNVPGSGDTSAVSGIQRVWPDGRVELLHSEVDGRTLFGPNARSFGPYRVYPSTSEQISSTRPSGQTRWMPGTALVSPLPGTLPPWVT